MCKPVGSLEPELDPVGAELAREGGSEAAKSFAGKLRSHKLSCTLYGAVFFTLNHPAYNAGRNSRVKAVATINPPMIATAIGP